MRAWHLQEGFYKKYTAVLEIRRTLRAAKDKTLAELFNDCSSLSVAKTPSQLDSWRKFWDLQPDNEQGAICFLLTLPSLGEWTHSCCDVGNCQYYVNIIMGYCSALRFSLFHLTLAYCKRESSSLFFVGFIVVVEEIYTSVPCYIGDIFWTCNLCFLLCCFSGTMIRKLFSHFL